MSRFIKGDTAYFGRGDSMRKLTVKGVINNSFLPVLQYSFEEVEFICGEQSLREDPDGADLRMSDCFKENYQKEHKIRINTIASAKRNLVSEENAGLTRNSFFDDTRVDFKPDLFMARWLGEYAQGKLIIHVGSGQGHLVNMLKMGNKARVVGIEPNIDKEEWIKWRLQNDGANIEINEILEGGVEKYANMITALGKDKTILIIARPKAMDFVQTTLKLMPDGMELLFISLNEKCFLGNYADKAIRLDHKGISEESEVVYSIIK